jgi:Ca2+-binding RTX toxin-like protein
MFELSGDITAMAIGTLSNIETSNLTGTTSADTITLTGAQLDAILIGAGTLNLSSGTDTINLTSTSADLNALSNTALSGVEIISAASATSGVTITLGVQSEGFTITGSDYDDFITGGTVVDTISAGAGNDTIYIANSAFDTGESIDGGDDTDTIVLTNATSVAFLNGTLTSIENLIGSNSNDTVTFSAAQWGAFTSIDLGLGTDVLNVRANGDISGMSITTLGGVETGNLSGTNGNDSITLSGEQLDAILIGTGTANLGTGTADTINLTSTSDDLNTLSNARLSSVEFISAHLATAGVTITLGVQSEILNITGGGYDDVITGGTAADQLTGGAGHDVITGGGGIDTIHGGLGDDTINGGTSNDILYGDEGADIFTFSATTSIDTLADFNVGDFDKIDISSILTGFTPGVSDIDNYLTFSVSGADTIVRVDANGLSGGSSFTQIATISNVTGLVVQDLYDNGHILV